MMTRQALAGLQHRLAGPDPGKKVLAPGILCAPEHQDAGKDRVIALVATQLMNLASSGSSGTPGWRSHIAPAPCNQTPACCSQAAPARHLPAPTGLAVFLCRIGRRCW